MLADLLASVSGSVNPPLFRAGEITNGKTSNCCRGESCQLRQSTSQSTGVQEAEAGLPEGCLFLSRHSESIINQAMGVLQPGALPGLLFSVEKEERCFCALNQEINADGNSSLCTVSSFLIEVISMVKLK